MNLSGFLYQRMQGHTYQFFDAIFLGIAPMILVGLSAIVFIAAWSFLKKEPIVWSTHGMVIAFAVTGCLVGLLIGASREPIVGAALPILVTLITGFLTYYMSKDTIEGLRSVIPAMIIAVAFGAGFGSYYSAIPRSEKEKNLFRAEKLTYPIKVNLCGLLSDKMAEGSAPAKLLFEEHKCL